MTYKKIMTKLYCKLLGESVHMRLKELQILQNQIGFETPDGEFELISETTVGQIIKGKRNLSFNASLAFQTSLNYPTPRKLFFPNKEFMLQLFQNLIIAILTDPIFDNSLLKKILKQKLRNYSISSNEQVSDFTDYYQETLITSLLNFISEFPEEETSYQIAEKLTDWLSEFAYLISQF
ncbi:hypothetical protein NML69_00445 [Streptococcus sp. CF8-6]|nr:hypothetical protein [Streptococcus sp. CF8-6]MCP9016453.1 hypothetical protein [Streptococcus sp. CF8-6]